MTHSMEVSIEVMLSDEAAGEVVLDVDFKVTSSGCAAHMGSLSYAGHPAEPPEISIEHIYWPYHRKLKEGEQRTERLGTPEGFTLDHIDMPWSALPQNVAEAIEAYIVEHWEDPGPDPDYGLEDLRDRP